MRSGDGLPTAQLGPGLDAAQDVASTSDGGLIVAGTIGRGAISTSFDLGRHTKIRFTISPTRRMRLTLTGRVIDAFLNRIDVKTSALIKK